MSLAREHYETLMAELCEGARLGRLEVQFSLRSGARTRGVPLDIAAGCVWFANGATDLHDIETCSVGAPPD